MMHSDQQENSYTNEHFKLMICLYNLCHTQVGERNFP